MIEKKIFISLNFSQEVFWENVYFICKLSKMVWGKDCCDNYISFQNYESHPKKITLCCQSILFYYIGDFHSSKLSCYEVKQIELVFLWFNYVTLNWIHLNFCFWILDLYFDIWKLALNKLCPRFLSFFFNEKCPFNF